MTTVWLWTHWWIHVDHVVFHPWTRRMLSVGVYIFVPFVLLSISLPNPNLDAARQYGVIAQVLVLIALFMKPLGIILGIRLLKRGLVYRRQIGVAAFWFALFHGTAYMVTGSVVMPDSFAGWGNFLLYGGLALIGMLILGLTSNNLSQRILRRHWKTVQTLAYPTLFLILLHASMAEGEMTKVVVLTGLFIVLKILERRRITFWDGRLWGAQI